MEMETPKPQSHVALLCSPGMGHIIPSLELATRLSTRLSTRHHLTVTIFIVTSHSSSAENKLIASANAANLFAVVRLPLPDMPATATDSSVVALIALTMRHAVPLFRSAVSALPSSPSALIADIFATESFAVADEFHMAKYVFVTSNAWFLALTVYLHVLDKQVVGQYVDRKEPLQIPGCEPVRPSDVVSPMMDRSEPQYAEYLRISLEIAGESDGILVNTWEELEGRTLAEFEDRTGLGRIVKQPVYAIGPIARQSESVNEGNELLLFEWLGKQEEESVMYVSFGSGGTLSFEQMREMAWGLEMSGERFIWVVRVPMVRPDAAYFTVAEKSDAARLLFLPEGFLERTSEVGFVVWWWAEQAAVLGHPAVGGFLTHGGWNSAVEGITNGVPMIVWPLYAEQRMNATMLAEEVGVAVRPEGMPAEEVVGRAEIAAMVKKVMGKDDEEGKAIRAKAKQLKLSAHKASAEGGSSYHNFSRLVKLFGSL